MLDNVKHYNKEIMLFKMLSIKRIPTTKNVINVFYRTFRQFVKKFRFGLMFRNI